MNRSRSTPVPDLERYHAHVIFPIVLSQCLLYLRFRWSLHMYNTIGIKGTWRSRNTNMNMSWTASVQMQVDVRMFLFLTASVKARPLKNYRQSSDNKSMHHFPTRKAEWCGLIFCALHCITPVLTSVSLPFYCASPSETFRMEIHSSQADWRRIAL